MASLLAVAIDQPFERTTGPRAWPVRLLRRSRAARRPRRYAGGTTAAGAGSVSGLARRRALYARHGRSMRTSEQSAAVNVRLHASAMCPRGAAGSPRVPRARRTGRRRANATGTRHGRSSRPDQPRRLEPAGPTRAPGEGVADHHARGERGQHRHAPDIAGDQGRGQEEPEQSKRGAHRAPRDASDRVPSSRHDGGATPRARRRSRAHRHAYPCPRKMRDNDASATQARARRQARLPAAAITSPATIQGARRMPSGGAGRASWARPGRIAPRWPATTCD